MSNTWNKYINSLANQNSEDEEERAKRESGSLYNWKNYLKELNGGTDVDYKPIREKNQYDFNTPANYVSEMQEKVNTYGDHSPAYQQYLKAVNEVAQAPTYTMEDMDPTKQFGQKSYGQKMLEGQPSVIQDAITAKKTSDRLNELEGIRYGNRKSGENESAQKYYDGLSDAARTAADNWQRAQQTGNIDLLEESEKALRKAVGNNEEAYTNALTASGTLYEFNKNKREGKNLLTSDETKEYASLKLSSLKGKEREAIDLIAEGQRDQFAMQSEMTSLSNIGSAVGLSGFRQRNLANASGGKLGNANAGRGNQKISEGQAMLKALGWDQQKIDEYTDYSNRIQGEIETNKYNNQFRIDPNASRGTKVAQSIANSVYDLAYAPYRGVQGIMSNIEGDKSGLGRNAYSGYNIRNNSTEEAQSQVINNAITSQHPLGQRAYQIGMSVGESAEMALVGSVVGGAIAAEAVSGGATMEAASKSARIAQNLITLPSFGFSAYNSGYNDAKARGLSEGQAQSYGIATGVAEAATEMFSLDHFWDMAKGTKVGKNILVDWIAQAGIEGSEEVASNILNRFSDWVIAGDQGKNQMTVDIENIKAENPFMSDDEAKEIAYKNWWEDTAQTFVDGAISGAMFGAAGAASSAYKGIKVGKQDKQIANVHGENSSYGKNPEQLRTDVMEDVTEEDQQRKAQMQEYADKVAEGKKLTLSEKADIAQLSSEAKYKEYANEVINGEQKVIDVDQTEQKLTKAASEGDLESFSEAYKDLKTSVDEGARNGADNLAESYKTQLMVNSGVTEEQYNEAMGQNSAINPRKARTMMMRAGGMGLDYEQAKEAGGLLFEGFSDNQLREMYKEGADRELKESKKALRDNVREVLGAPRDLGTFKGENVSEEDAVAFEALAATSGINFVQKNSIADVNGKTVNATFNSKTNTITFTEGTQISIGHEIGEFIQKYNQEDHDSLTRDLMGLAQSLGGSFQSDFDRYKKTYIAVEGSKSDMEVAREMTNDLIVDILMTEKGQDAFVKYLNNEYEAKVAKGKVQAIKDFFKKLADSFRKIFSNIDGLNSFQKKMLDSKAAELESYGERLVEIYDKAVKSSQNQQASESTSFVDSEERYAIEVETKEKLKDNEYILNNKKTVANSDSLVSIADSEATLPFKNAGKTLESLFSKINGVKTELGYVDVNKTSASSIVGHKPTRTKLLVASQIDKILSEGKVVYFDDTNARGKGYEVAVIAAPITVEGGKYSGEYLAGAQINIDPSHNQYYLDEVVEIKRDNTLPLLHTEVIGDKGYPSVINILQSVLGYKDNYMPAQDSLGNKLTYEQKEFYRYAKTIDANGNLKIFYHGSSAYGFDVFDIKKAKSAGLYGRGFYFSDSDSHAGQYGQTYQVYLNITNPLAPGTNNITKAQLKKFVNEIANDEDYGIENYGYNATPDSVVNTVWGSDDFRMLQDINATCVGDFVETVKLFNKINGTNYDGIQAPTETVAFYANQIKDVNNKKPTSVESIHFSLSPDEFVTIEKKSTKTDKVDFGENLIAVHNLTVDQLDADIDLKGLPSPSIAIIKAGMEHSKYGDVSLAFKRDTIDPKSNKANKVYGGDAWTPTFPTVEYRINRDKAYDLSDKIRELVTSEDERAFEYVPLDVDNLEDKANKNEGNLVEGYKDKRIFKLAFIRKGNNDYKIPYTERQVNFISSEGHPLEILEFIPKALGVEKFKDYAGGLFIHKRIYENPSIGREVIDAFNKAYREVLGLDADFYGDEIKLEFKPDVFKIARSLSDARKVFEGKTSTTVTEFDKEKFNSDFESAGGQEQYEKWLEGLFTGIVDGKGLRNEKDVFLPSGNRRSWNQLHDEYNLENIVKIMNQRDSKGADGFFAEAAFQAIATKDFKSIEELHENEHMLGAISEEEYEALQDEHRNRLAQIANEIKNPKEDNYFIAIEEAIEIINDALKKGTTVAAIQRELNKNSQWLDLKKDTAQKIHDLYVEVSNMPTGYFEAKPRRAVWLNEIALAVVPNTASEEIITKLESNKIPYQIYEAGNEKQRADILENAEDLRFSVNVDSEGNQLTEAQAEHFAESKARDKEGRLLKLYHGTANAGFTVFNPGRYGGIWLTTSREDAGSYGGTDKTFVPGEEGTSRNTVGGNIKYGAFRFETEQDRDEFITAHSDIKEYKTAREIERLYYEAEDAAADAFDSEEEDEIWEEYERVKSLSEKIRRDYFAYEKKHMGDTPITELANHPERYSVYDLKRAWLAVDSNASFDDEYEDYETDEDFKQALASSLREHIKEYEDEVDYSQFTARTRIGIGQEANETTHTNQRIYEVYANVKNPKVLNAHNTDIAFDLGYRVIEEALKDSKYDGVIVINAAQGRYKKAATLVIPKASSQISLTTNEKPTNSNDIRYSIGVPDEGGWVNFDDDYDDELSIFLHEGETILEKGMEALKGKSVDQAKIRGMAIRLRNEFGSSYNVQQFEDMLTKAFAYMQTQQHVNYEDMMSILKDIAKPVIEEATTLEGEQEYRDFVNALKPYSIKLTDTQKQEVISAFGSYGNFKNAMMPIRISDKGTSLDSLWSEISSINEALLPYDTLPGSQPMVLHDALAAMRPTPVSEYGGNIDEVAGDLAMRIVEEYIGGEEGRRMQSVIKDYKQKLKKDYDARLAEAKKQVKYSERYLAAEYRKGLDDKYAEMKQKQGESNAEYRKRLKEQADFRARQAEYNARWKQAENNAKYDAKREQLKQEYLEKQAKLIANNRHRAEQAKEREAIRTEKKKINVRANKLMKWIINPTEQNHVPTKMVKPILDFLQAFDFVAPTIVKNENGKWSTKILKMVDNNGRRVFDTIEGDSYDEVLRSYEDRLGYGEGSQNARKWYERMETVRSYYEQAANGQFEDESMAAVLGNLDASLYDQYKNILAMYRGKADINNMGSADLKVFKNMLSNIMAAVNKGNKANSVNAEIPEMGREIIKASESKNLKDRFSTAEGFYNFFRIDNVNPRTFMKLLGESGTKLYKALRDGMNTRTWDIKKASDYMTQAKGDLNLTEKDLQEWTGAKATIHTFNVSGGSMQITTAQIMGLYETLKRSGAKDRMKGGIKVGTIERGRLEKSVKQGTTFHLSEENVKDIFSVLTKEQIALADKMQWYMANECSKQGNEVSEKLYGYTKFEDPTYYPYTVDQDTIDTRDLNDKAESFTGIERSGFTNALKEGANNPLVIKDIFDVFTSHVEDMASYHGYAAANKDVLRWLNFKEKTQNDNGIDVDWVTTKDAINVMTGSRSGVKYIEQLLKDLNRMEKATDRVELLGNVMGNYKAAAVGANLRVVLQQPTAYLRALNEIDPKYLLAVKPRKGMAQYAIDNNPTALWKSWGYYETNIGKSMKEVIVGQTDKVSMVQDKLMAPAGVADDITWGFLYAAVEKEQRDLLKGKGLSEAEFRQAVNDRFDEVVDKTQVVDSTLHRSQIMRGTTAYDKIATAFMAEPTKSYNMLLEAAIEDAREGKASEGKRTARAVAAFVLSSAATSAAAAVMDAFRYDDDDEKWGDVWWQKFIENAFDNLNPLTNIPVIKDVAPMLWDAAMGKTVDTGSRMDLEAFSSFATALAGWGKLLTGKNNKTAYGFIMMNLKPISQLTGIPLYNLTRDVVAITNQFHQDLKTTVEKPTDVKKGVKISTERGDDVEDIQDQITEGLEKGITIKELRSYLESQYKEKYFELMQEGNVEEAQKLAEMAAPGFAATLMTDEEIDKMINEWAEESVTYSELDKAIASGEGIAEALERVREAKKDDKIVKHIMDRFQSTIEYEDAKSTDTGYRERVDEALKLIDGTNTYESVKEAYEKDAEEKAAAKQLKEEKAAIKNDLFDAIDNSDTSGARKSIQEMLDSGMESKDIRDSISTKYHKDWLEATDSAEKNRIKNNCIAAQKNVINMSGDKKAKDPKKSWEEWEKDHR